MIIIIISLACDSVELEISSRDILFSSSVCMRVSVCARVYICSITRTLVTTRNLFLKKLASERSFRVPLHRCVCSFPFSSKKWQQRDHLIDQSSKTVYINIFFVCNTRE